jgi:hypothetical protein
MMNEILIEILELPNQLREKFTGKVNRPDISQSNGSNQRWQETSNSAPVAFVLPLHLNG